MEDIRKEKGLHPWGFFGILVSFYITLQKSALISVVRTRASSALIRGFPEENYGRRTSKTSQ